MRTLCLSLLVTLPLFSADDAWKKVRDLKTGTELRIVKRGAAQPILAKMDEANDERLVVVVKNEQVAIPKEAIDRIDYRPPRTNLKVTKHTTVTENDPAAADVRPHPPTAGSGPGTSMSSGVSYGGDRPGFETIYRRPATTPAR